MVSQRSVHTQRTDDQHFNSCLPRVGRWLPKVLCTLREWKIITSPVVSRESTDVCPGSVHTPRVDHHNLNNCIRESANNPTLTYLTVNAKFVGHVGLVGQTRLSRCMCSLSLWPESQNGSWPGRERSWPERLQARPERLLARPAPGGPKARKPERPRGSCAQRNHQLCLYTLVTCGKQQHERTCYTLVTCYKQVLQT